MASIIERAIWTCTDEVAELLVEKGLITRCDAEHEEIFEVDKPIYHRSNDAPLWFGFTTIPGELRKAQKEIEEA